MAYRNIVIAPFGNNLKTFSEHWLKYKDEKQFDLCLLLYPQEITNPERFKDVDFVYHLKGLKFEMNHRVLTEVHPEWQDQYDYFFFMDDDLELDTRGINRMFALAAAHDTWIAQPSLSKDSFSSWPILRTNKNCYLRYIGMVECMAPVFNRYALKKCVEVGSFIASKTNWGIEGIWSKVLGFPKDKIVIFDEVTMRHMFPAGGRGLYDKLGIDPHEDWKTMAEKFGIKKQIFTEHGRLLRVNSSKTPVLSSWYSLLEKKNKIKQAINDYDVMSRVRSRLNKAKRLFIKSPQPVKENG